MTPASNKLAKAQEAAALKGLRAAVPFYLDATDALAAERRYDAAVGVLAEVLNAREKKRSLFGSKEIDPLGPDRAIVGKQFAKLSRFGQINDPLLELLSAIAAQSPDDPDIRLANAEGLYRAGYLADAIDEYRYCQKLVADDGALVARLGELYAMMSRGPEAVENLRTGIGELMQAHRFDQVPFFSRKLVEIEPQAQGDVQRWMESLPDDALRRSRGDVVALVDAVRDKGLDDGRWSSLEQRLASLPPLDDDEEALAAAALHAYTAKSAPPQASDEPAAPEPALAAEGEPHVETEPEPEPVWGSKTGNVTIGRSAWEDVSNVEPASEDEMRLLLGPQPEPVKKEEAPPARTPAAPVNGASRVSTGPPPVAGGGLPPGLAAFTRRKADAAFSAGDFAAAAVSYERLLKSGFDAEVAKPLLECYLGTERFAEAATLGLQLSDHQAEAGELDRAVGTLGLILEHTDNADVAQRHAELLAAK